MSMSAGQQAIEMMRMPRNMNYWHAVEDHPLGAVVPGLVAITASQWKFWEQRPLIVQADLALGSNAIAVAKEETAEKKFELEKLYRGDTTPLMVAMEAADELVFLDIFVGMHANDMGIWAEVKDEALELAHGAMDTIVHMQKLAHRRKEFDVSKLLGDLPRFVADTVISDKNASNYNPAYFVPVPSRYGDHDKSQLVEDHMIVSVYERARKEARRVRTAIKQQGLYTANGMPNHLGIFARKNGHTPVKFRDDEAIVALQESLRDHYRFFVETFGSVGLDHLVNYFRLNNPPMIEVVESAIVKS